MTSLSHDQPTLWDVPTPSTRRRRRGLFAPTSEGAGAAVSDDAKAAQRQRIMDALWAYGPQTYAELSERADVKLQSLCWRMRELKGMDAVRFVVADGKLLKRNGGRLVEATYTPRKRANACRAEARP